MFCYKIFVFQLFVDQFSSDMELENIYSKKNISSWFWIEFLFSYKLHQYSVYSTAIIKKKTRICISFLHMLFIYDIFLCLFLIFFCMLWNENMIGKKTIYTPKDIYIFMVTIQKKTLFICKFSRIVFFYFFE